MHSSPLPHLNSFALTAELGSFSAAAKQLNVTQSAISQRIHLLEVELDTALFRRHAGRVELTDAGRILHEYALKISSLHFQAREMVTGRRSEICGDLLIAASSIPGEHLLPPLLAEFRSRYPRVRLAVTVTDSTDVIGRIERGEAHVGFVGERDERPHLVYTSFAQDQMVLVVPRKHRWRNRRRIQIEELLDQPLVQRERGSGTRCCFDRALKEQGISMSRLRVELEQGSNEAVKESVRRGMGLAVLSNFAVERETASEELHALEIVGLGLKRELFVVQDRRRALPATAHLFLVFRSRAAQS